MATNWAVLNLTQAATDSLSGDESPISGPSGTAMQRRNLGTIFGMGLVLAALSGSLIWAIVNGKAVFVLVCGVITVCLLLSITFIAPWRTRRPK
jgi:type IV secretory pathway VirB6-like protein